MSVTSALMKKRGWYLKNTFRELKKQSSLKVYFILGFILFFETGLTWFFIDGFQYLDSFGGMGAMIINKLFALFFLGMGIMLILSGIVTTYSTTFRSDEIPYLLTGPFSITEIVTNRFLESTHLSSWAFFFIIIPFAGSFAWHQHMSPVFALWTVLFSVPFLLLCSGIGSILAFLLVRWFPRGRLLKISLVLGVIAACVIVWLIMHGSGRYTGDVTFRITRLVPGLKLASNALIPSYWISEGIIQLTRGNWFRGLMFLGTVTSSSAISYIVLERLGLSIFYDAWQKTANANVTGRRAPILFARLASFLSFLPGDIRGILMKDLRIFFRDPLQWSQALVFFGLLAVYFANLRSFNYQQVLPVQWFNMIAFLNVFSVSAVMTSLGSRFVYPQLSLEGHGFWILGLSPTTKKRIVMTKFFTSLAGMTGVSVILILLSTHMMDSPFSIKIVAVALACAISLAISGLSTGLGAIFLDLDQRNPAAIVSGFGGTLNLVLCLGFMLAAIFPFAMVFHIDAMPRFHNVLFVELVSYAFVWLLVLTFISTFIPLWIGIKTLHNRDF